MFVSERTMASAWLTSTAAVSVTVISVSTLIHYPVYFPLLNKHSPAAIYVWKYKLKLKLAYYVNYPNLSPNRP